MVSKLKVVHTPSFIRVAQLKLTIDIENKATD